MGPLIAGAMAGFGQGLNQFGNTLQKQWGEETLRKMADDSARERQAALIEAQKEMQGAGFAHADQSQARTFEHADKSQAAGFGHAEKMQTSQQDFTAGENRLSRSLQREMQEAGFTHTEVMQENALEHAAKENALNRQVTREGHGIQAAQVKIMAQGAELDRTIKQMQIKNAIEVDNLKSAYRTETDPAKKAAISDSISILTGKDSDKFLPVPLKDEMGNITGYKIFDTKRGTFVDQSADNKADPLGLRGKLSGAKPAQATPRAAPLVEEPPGSQPPPGREQGLAARKRGIINAQMESDRARKEEYGDSAY